MKRSRFSDEQIIAILKEHEAGMATAEICRRHGISPATFYKWKAKYGGLEVSEAKRLRSLEDENAKLKKLLAEAMLDIAVLKDITAKKHVLSLSKGGDARSKAGGCGTCSGCVRPERAPCVQHYRGVPAGERLCVAKAGRQHPALPIAGLGVGTPPVRLSASGLSSGARRHHTQP
jgi:putative transposase